MPFHCRTQLVGFLIPIRTPEVSLSSAGLNNRRQFFLLCSSRCGTRYLVVPMYKYRSPTVLVNTLRKYFIKVGATDR